MIPLVLIAVILILLVMIALVRAYKNEHQFQKNSTDLSAISASFCISGGGKFFS